MGAIANDRNVNAAPCHALIRFAEALISLRPLIDALPQPVGLIFNNGNMGSLPDLGLLNRVASRLHAPCFQFTSPANESSVLNRIVTNRLACIEHLTPGEHASLDIDSLVDDAVSRSFERYCDRAEALSCGGVPINAYAAGDPNRKAVVIASVCGMPAKLCEPWIRFLARNYFVITWETRGLFGKSRFFKKLDCSVQAQTADAFAAMDQFRVRRAHFMGMCGGALIALAAAAQEPVRVSSLSIWHGDLELGPACPKTSHQRDLQALMSMATEQRVSPSDLHFVLCQSMAANVPDDLAPLVLYPYANPELLFTYCRLNGNIMRANATQYLPQVQQPTLVVTSEDDETAHPAGSKSIAAALPRAALRVESHGNHISLFRGTENLRQIAADFIARQNGPLRSATPLD